jgi:hypothetical protein
MVVTQSGSAFAAAPSVTLNGSSSPVPNLKAGQVVKVAAGAGSFPPGDTIAVLECNEATDTSGSGCDTNGIQATTANVDGSISPVSYTLKSGAVGSDPALKCLPPSSANIKAGVACIMTAVDLNDTTKVGFVPFFDVPKLTHTTITGGNVTVTCTKIGNLMPAATLIQEKVDFKKNGVTVTKVTNKTGTVKATFAAAIGNKVQCVGEKFGQKSKSVTL